MSPTGGPNERHPRRLYDRASLRLRAAAGLQCVLRPRTQAARAFPRWGVGQMTLTLHEHPFAAYCWKVLVALFERDVPFERHFVGGEADRARLGELWAMASIPVLVDDAAGLTLPESTTIVEYLDGHGAAPGLVPSEPAAALQAR